MNRSITATRDILFLFFVGGVVPQRGGVRGSRLVLQVSFGGLTARNCLRELCCELVSAIVYVVAAVEICDYD